MASPVIKKSAVARIEAAERAGYRFVRAEPGSKHIRLVFAAADGMEFFVPSPGGSSSADTRGVRNFVAQARRAEQELRQRRAK